MPQVDFITFFITIFWFCFFLILGFIFLNFKILFLLNNQKRNILIFENFKLNFLANKQYISFFCNTEDKLTTKF